MAQARSTRVFAALHNLRPSDRPPVAAAMADNKTNGKTSEMASTRAASRIRTERSNDCDRDTADDTPMEGIEQTAAERVHTTPGNNTSPPPGLSAKSTTILAPTNDRTPSTNENSSTALVSSPSIPSPIQPQSVQDPLATGLSHTYQTLEQHTISTNNDPATAAASSSSASTTESATFQFFYSEYVEDEFLRSAELITAARTDRQCFEIPTWQKLTSTSDSSAIRSLLAALAFDIQATDEWNTLGLSRLEGPKPNVLMLKSRRDVASKLIDSCIPYLSEVAQQEMSRAKNKIHQACDDCCNGLEANARERKSIKGITRQVPRWFEPSQEMLAFLLAQTPQEGKLAMHLSNLNGTDIARSTAVVDTPTCRQLHANLCGPPEEIERTLGRWGKQPLLTWAPIDNGQLLKVAAAVRKLIASTPTQAALVLVVPFDPYPACEHVSNLTDVWDHPLLHEKWNDVLVDINLIIPPTRIIVSGTHAPIHTCKCLALFTLGRANTPATPRLTTYRPKFYSFGSGPVIYVDVPAQFRFAIKGVVSSLNIPGVQEIDNPRNSLGSTKEAPRASIQVHMQAGRIPPVHMEAPSDGCAQRSTTSVPSSASLAACPVQVQCYSTACLAQQDIHMATSAGALWSYHHVWCWSKHALTRILGIPISQQLGIKILCPQAPS